MENISTAIETQKNANRHLQKLMLSFEKRSTEGLTKGYIQSLLEEVELTYKHFKDDHEHICETIHEYTIQESDVPYLSEDFYYVFFDNYLAFKAKLLDLSAESTAPQQHQQQQLSSTFVSTAMPNSSFPSAARLPKVELPSFTGDYIEWIPYRDTFLALVHHNQCLTGIQKYFYLKSSCKGSPLEIINQYPASENNYAAAWNALEERYHNTRKIVEQILKRLFNLPASNGSFESIKELLDTTRSSISLLKSLNIEVDKWDAMLIYFTSQKLNKHTRKEWEQTINSNSEIPPMSSMLKFLEMSFRTLESVEEAHNSSILENTRSFNRTIQPRFNNKAFHANNIVVDNSLCPCCQRRHPLYKCFKFSSLDPAEKKHIIQQNNICSNCLHCGHNNDQCLSFARCQQCKQNHHTILHSSFFIGNPNTQSNTSVLSTTVENFYPSTSRSALSTEQFNANVTSHAVNYQSQVLLATANVLIKHSTGIHTVKALVDPGSQASFITNEMSKMLNLNTQRIDETYVCGIGVNNKTSINSYVQLQLLSNYDKNVCLRTEALVINKLTSYKPQNIKKSDLPNLQQFTLANPTFYLPSKIDILLGSDLYGDILLANSFKFPNSVYLQESVFGWLVSGPIVSCSTELKLSTNTCNLENQLRMFWEQEELLEERKLSLEEELCESYFNRTYTKDPTGRYTVNLPFKNILFGKSLPKFNHTDFSALKRFKQLESSFRARPQFAAAYKQFVEEYINLNHMEKVGKYPQDMPLQCFFLPHHGVFRESSTTTKLRVVFDASNKTPHYSSLNEELSPGPPLQNDLPDILTRWRRFRIAFSSDLEKMFRQINVCEEHQNYQCILWRDENTNDLNIYKLRTVTYGTTCAPFLAIRVLKQIAIDGAEKFPLASKVLKTDTYVDDVISGADTCQESILLYQQLRKLLDGAGFNLRKWNSNSTEFLKHIPQEYLATQNFELQKQEMVKALGISWDPLTDCFSFKINSNFSENITKSSVLSDSAKLFDPLGWLSPTTILAKIMFQKLWREGLDWADTLPIGLSNEWSSYRSALKDIEKLKIPRWFNCISTAIAELHAFCDSSKLAFAVAVYVRVVAEDGKVSVSLIQAKTKVAPLKVLTIPKLELCAAVLAAKLVDKTKRNIGLNISKITYWSDSSTVLKWIKLQSSLLPVYEANRVSQIQRLTSISNWKYISTKENPADCATRGLLPHELCNHALWWNGPPWLVESPEKWPVRTFTSPMPTTHTKINVATTTVVSNFEPTEYPSLFFKFSTFNKLQRITAYILRFYHNVKESIIKKKSSESIQVSTNSNANLCQYLSTAELKRAQLVLVKGCQQISFHDDIKCLSNRKCLPSNSKIINLQPFIDEDGVLRVGGRLKNSNLSFSRKYPILLHKKDPISILIFNDAHFKTLHGGVQLMQTYVMSKFWIISSRNIAKFVKRKCAACLKYTAKASQQIMGNLPSVRIQPARPFKHSGLDYAGPIVLKQSTLRKSSTSKGYICLFVCMCTKAIHLEAVSSLTTEAFLAAFKRFISRRGSCTDLYSDCGTTFVGASKELLAMHNRSRSSIPAGLAETLGNEGTHWHFIPPASPHFGGLWEAGVKATKHHLYRIMRDRILTFEELSTLLCQIESCLNSRPLCPLSSDPSDLNVLTPAHFLVGEPTTTISEGDLLDANIDRLTRWKQIEKLKQHFWQRWSQEYISRLQSRPKWNSIKRETQIGDIVLVLHERYSPGQWPLARVEQVHPGSDGHVRVVTLYCNGKYIKRPVAKICVLPANDDNTLNPVCGV